MSLTPAKVKALLGDLGKPTLRGVRRCPKCSTLNGTRGISCKNVTCDVVFKECGRRKGHSAEAVRLLTTGGDTGGAPPAALFSVRLRDRGPDYRGFVQLSDSGAGNGVQEARCTVDTCARAPQTTCGHVRAAVSCVESATPLALKNSVLNGLAVSSDVKHAIWLLATETAGPLVQRVTRGVMAVKCRAHATRHPFALLHVAFFETSRNRSQPEKKFHCSCKAFKLVKPCAQREERLRRCIHFYACICAFSSDDELAEEFAYYIGLIDTPIPDQLQRLITIVAPPDEQALAALATTAETVDITVTELPAVMGGDVVDDGDVDADMTAASVEVIIDEDGMITSSSSEAKRRCTDELQTIGADSLVQASSALLTLVDGTLPLAAPVGRTSPRKAGSGSTKSSITQKKAPVILDEMATLVSFHQWLASITERINQTMHYQFDGSPEPLVFHAPQDFFDCLQQRISAGNKKKRLPNSTTGFVRRDALPLGMFTKYTWNITNILHVKQIFDTLEMPLDITRSFVENRDGTFDLYEAPLSTEVTGSIVRNQPPIRPFELKTYIRVGNTTADQKEPTPFIIEWIPDILPRCRIGELRIKFEYGHQRNGQIEQRTAAPANLQLQTIHIQ